MVHLATDGETAVTEETLVVAEDTAAAAEETEEEEETTPEQREELGACAQVGEERGERRSEGM